MKRVAQPSPRTCFWELTRVCRLDCRHCRTHAAVPARDELSIDEALATAGDLAALGVKTVVFTGGEPILYPGWERVARRLSESGVTVRLFASGHGFSDDTLEAAIDAGVTEFAVSLDGPKPIHDRLRPALDIRVTGTFDAAVALIEMIVRAGAACRAVTQVNAMNARFLVETYRLVVALGVPRWQVHLCQMSGSASDRRAELMCEPRDLERVSRVLMLAAREKKVHAPMHCTIGYMTVEEPILRGREMNARPVWGGCGAGLTTMAITPAGYVKGCVTLPDEFVTGNVREAPLAEIWGDDARYPYARAWDDTMLEGACASCAFGAICRAGCRSVAYTATGSIGLNPYCLKIVRENRA
ncbi:radical SAM protein [bacterium]|nr:radical SAM protein [bacterium]